MADFLLDRIRFKWRAGWTTGTNYNKDDIVYYRGRVYVCLVGHTSGADIRNDFGNWELMLDGQEWRGEWQTSTVYGIGNIVKYNGYVYRCTENHTSVILSNLGLPNDIDNWTLLATTYDWKNIWTTETNYNLGDVVRYNGIVYICTEKHLSSETEDLGLEDDQSKWTIVVTSDNWTSDWQTSIRYIKNDIVKYGGIVYRCIEGHTSAETTVLGLEADQSKWEVVLSGIEYKGSWSSANRYKLNDIVKVDSSLYICIDDHTSTNFNSDLINWQVWLPGVGHENVWNSTTQYDKGDIVIYGGYTYLALNRNISSPPSVDGLIQNEGTWELIVTGYRHRGEWDIINEYVTGDVVRHGGYLYVAIDDNIASDPNLVETNWTLIVPGFRFRAEWQDNTMYYLNDVVTFKGTAYTCITRHESTASDSRPDLDQELDETDYWQIVIKGSENNVLENIGDIRIFDTEINNLAIGDAGQTLKISNNLPNWSDFGVVEKIYFVSTQGRDEDGFGFTENSPFRTVAFACEYIQNDLEERAPATIFIKTGIYEEILPISVPRDVALVGDELRSTVIQPGEGYETSNMFYVRNGSGIRNMTLQGLNGTLLPPNQYFTRRPTAGAYVSLDPGTGQSDNSAWITSKSPYIQNVTTFGTGCVGLKVDGGLHNGGNRSIVANDFTQVLDDGIGAWVANKGRSELVSVFTYFNHIGYLSENGGKIRATNGNNSYGTYGSVSEGVSTDETPITATVDNRTKEAEVGIVHNNGNEIITIAYSNAGQEYSSASINFEGSGVGASASLTDFRSGGISRVRIEPNGDSSIPGGLNYTYVAGNAQDGNTSTITLNAGDLQVDPTVYEGLRIFITSGAGVGQYGYIFNYDESTKVATIYKESDDTPGWDHIDSNYSIVSELNLTTRYLIEPRIIFDAPSSGVTAFGRAVVESSRIVAINLYDPGSGYNSSSPPEITVIDKTNTVSANFDVYVSNGVLGKPTFSDRGTGYVRSSATITGNGFAENYQTGNTIRVENLSRLPSPGDNIEISGIEEVFYRLARVTDISGTEPSLSANIQLFPTINDEESPDHNTGIVIRQNYSQVRLTGHDFLDIGTGNVNSTRYPQLYVEGVDSLNEPQQQNEVLESAGGRVFYTSTDQNGNFRVGELFKVEQDTGIVTVNASQFDLQGLTEISLGGIQVGGSAVVIKEFSKDGTFTVNSNNIVPTQAAIIKYLTSRIAGGSSNATTNKLTAGQITIETNSIGSNGERINIPTKVNFTGGISGDMLAIQLFKHRSNR